jgi:hypothetical protein
VRYVTDGAVLSLTRKQVIGIALAAVLVLILVAALVKPSPHEVHMPGAEALHVQLVDSFPPPLYFSQAIQPSQSLNDVRCAIWRARHSQNSVCPDAATLAGMYFPKLTQSPRTLYILWLWCSHTMGADGFNVEYQSSRRAVVTHCYLARRWVWWQPKMTSTPSAEPSLSLLVVSTAPVPAGPVSIIEDARFEHLIGDQSTEYQLGTATIS